MAWLSLGFTILVFLVPGTVVRGDPSDLLLSWCLFSDIAIFAIALPVGLYRRAPAFHVTDSGVTDG
jgi:hypothetical protein